MSIQSGNLCFYYMGRENLCFLTLCEDSYPKRLAFLYLEEVADALVQEMIKDFGNNVSASLRAVVVTCRLLPSSVAATADDATVRGGAAHYLRTAVGAYSHIS